MSTADSTPLSGIERFEHVARRLLPPDRQEEVADLVASVKTVFGDLASGIAEAERHNEELRQSEARFRKIFHATYDAIFLVDPDEGVILDANEQAWRMLGYSDEELRGLTVSDLHPYEMARFDDFAEKVSRHGKWRTHELTCRTKSGEFIPAELSATSITFEGRPCMLVLAHDLREHRLAALGTAVSKISHDLRNILATAQLLSDHLARSTDPGVRRITPRLIGAIDRAIDLCKQTLAHGRVVEPKPRLATWNLRELVDEVAIFVGPPSNGRIAWHNRVPDILQVQADRDQMFRVLLNLGRNAVQAIGREGEIIVAAREEYAKTVVEFTDTGPGLPPEVRERLSQTLAASSVSRGAGLGLAIVHDLIKAHGGSISSRDGNGHGTTFRIELPREEGPPSAAG